MIVCPKCGCQLEDGSAFCMNCGCNLANAQQAAPQQAAPQQAAPQQTAPQQAAPQQTAPQQTAPQQAAPRQNPPKQGAPKQGGKKQGAPRQQAAPQQAAPQQAAPQQPVQQMAPQAVPQQPVQQMAPQAAPQQPVPQQPAPQATKICPNCGSMANAGDYVCYNCGTTFQMDKAPKPPKIKQPKVKVPGAAKSKKSLIIGIAGSVAAVAAVVIICIILFSGGKGKDFALYIQDREVVYSNLKKSGRTEITEYYNSTSSSSSKFFLTKNGVLFYPDTGSDFYTLYYCEVDNPRETSKRVANSVGAYEVNDGISLVTYKDSSSTLSQVDLKSEEKTKISNDVGSYYVSGDGKRIYFMSDGSLYYWESGKEKEKVSNEVGGVNHINENYKTVYFTKDGNLYKWEPGNEKEKLVSDVYKTAIYDSGKFYYTKRDTIEVDQEDYQEKYRDRFDVEGGEYDEDGHYIYDVIVYNLYYFNGKESEQIGSNMPENAFRSASENPLVAYREWEDGEYKNYLAAENQKQALTSGTFYDYSITSDGKALYYTVREESDDDADEGMDLYLITVDGTKIGAAEKYDTGVFYFIAYDKDNILYVKDRNAEKDTYDIYLNKKKVASDATPAEYDKESGKLYFVVDYDKDKDRGTVMMYYKDSTIKVSDDVSNADVTVNGNLLFLKEYNKNKSKGDLYYFDGGDSEKIDEDVTRIISPRTEK